MIDAIKKAILAGVGAAAVTTERAEKALNDLVERGKISASEARETAKKISDEGKQEFEDASKKLQARFDELADKVGRKNAKRIDALEAKVADLEKRLAEVEGSKGAKKSASK